MYVHTHTYRFHKLKDFLHPLKTFFRFVCSYSILIHLFPDIKYREMYLTSSFWCHVESEKLNWIFLNFTLISKNGEINRSEDIFLLRESTLEYFLFSEYIFQNVRLSETKIPLNRNGFRQLVLKLVSRAFRCKISHVAPTVLNYSTAKQSWKRPFT